MDTRQRLRARKITPKSVKEVRDTGLFVSLSTAADNTHVLLLFLVMMSEKKDHLAFLSLTVVFLTRDILQLTGCITSVTLELKHDAQLH